MVVDIVTRAEVEAPRVTRYRRMPRLTCESLGAEADDARQEACDQNRGHILTVSDGAITCLDCDARWEDFHY